MNWLDLSGQVLCAWMTDIIWHIYSLCQIEKWRMKMGLYCKIQLFFPHPPFFMLCLCFRRNSSQRQFLFLLQAESCSCPSVLPPCFILGAMGSERSIHDSSKSFSARCASGVDNEVFIASLKEGGLICTTQKQTLPSSWQQFFFGGGGFGGVICGKKSSLDCGSIKH